MMNFLRRVDMQLVIPVLILISISLSTIFSINGALFRNQFLFFILCFFVFFFFANTELESWEFFAKPIYIISLIALLILLFLGLESRGAVRWFDIGGYGIQFSEIFKPFLAIGLATFLAKRGDTKASTLGLITLLLLPVVFLIYKQPDLGSALIYVMATGITLLIYGFPFVWFGGAIVCFAAAIPLLFKFLHGYQQQRVLTFLHLTNDPLGTSYNAIQAMIAVGSGMLLGKGLGLGTQSSLRFLPERHTDFIFATLSEDLGFIGAGIVIFSFGFLLYRLYIIFKETESSFEKIFIAATFSLIFIQFFVNIGMNIGILPIVGVPLPFVSYGGSSLLSNAIFLGLASGIGSRHAKKSVLEIG
ncbi:MAG TPA: FtsW/RodA/SpoVE family cell cycle protein [Candidatus Saccharimonadales bacterium]|nr:FtsW/RodA/SpoVE family cell cycle protein [Candidatus Saccharimonadales bacterium]